MAARATQIEIYHVRIPLRKPIRHALATHTASENLVVAVTLDDGTVGYGEGVPRAFVTGDSIDECYGTLAEADYSALARPFDDYEAVVDFCGQYHPMPTDDPLGRKGNPARCAVELALLDGFGRRFGRPVSDVVALLSEAGPIAESQGRVRYSGAVTAAKPWKELVSALKMRLWGFAQVKVKVGMPGVDDGPRLRRLRRLLGRGVDIRVDANGGWTPQEATERIGELQPSRPTAVEQPIPDADREHLAEIRKASPTPIMLDESLASRQDAEAAIRNGWCDLFNIRLSKCGGFIASVRLAALACANGLGYQLGCQVGESGILSAAGRHFAASVGGIAYREGSYDRHLVRNSLLAGDITFGYGGWAPALPGPGLGIEVDPARLEACTVRRRRLDVL